MYKKKPLDWEALEYNSIKVLNLKCYNGFYGVIY